MDKFPKGLLNPGASTPTSGIAAGAAAAGWCARALGVECPTAREFMFNLFFTSYGVWMLLPLSVALLLVYRLVGPPEVDEREEELRQQWADHRQRFKSGAKRSSLRGVIKSSYLKELRDSGGDGGNDGVGRNSGSGGSGAAAAAAAAHGSSSSSARGPSSTEGRAASSAASGGDAVVDEDDDDSSWENVRACSGSSDASTVVGAAANAAAVAAATAVGAAASPGPFPRLPPPRETVHVLTTPGPTRVTIVGHRGGAAGSATGGDGGARWLSVLTLHAAGHNHRTCMGALEREVAKDEELGGVVFYHVDTPGHEEEAQDVEAKALSLEAQAAQLLEVTIKLGLTWFVGLGVGAGANVLLRFACDHPDMVAGLILANGSAEEAGRRERNAWLSARFRLSWEKDMKAARESLVPLSFPPHSSLGNHYRAGLGTMNSGNVLKYVDASICRDDIPVSRLKALNDVWTLLLCGTDDTGGGSSPAGYLTSLVAGVDAEEASRTLLDRLRRAAGGQASKATLVTLNGGGNGGGVLEAKPLEVLAAMKLFLNKCS
ncbi:unnamed protein product [Scytosiphon promiscuus]